MDFIKHSIDILLHLDKYLEVIIQNYGVWTYALIFIIIFCETGLVVTPFLPGDSILFATGALAATKVLGISTLFIVYYLAAVIGDAVNYYIGKKIGGAILDKKEIRYINKDYIIRAKNFYEKHGSMTIVLGRFIPIIRTFVPFVAGIGEMKYSKFIAYNLLGGALWIILFLGGGYLFGNLPFIKNHFSYMLIGIIIVSILPVIITFLKERKNN